jgi:hypothetical protein
MSLLGKIAALFGGGSASKVCVVDGDRLAGGDRVGPGERFQALNKLARFAAREELTVKVVFGGRPLREAGEGEKFNDVQVFYGETSDEVRKRLKKLAGGGAILVTSDQALENESADRGTATMRLSTLRRAMESSTSENGGREGGDRSGGFGGRDRERGEGGRRGGRNRSRGRGGDRRPREGGQPGGQPAPGEGSGSSRPAEQSPSSGSGGGDSSVKNLIDLVE